MPLLVLFHKDLMSSLGKDRRELRKTVWHCENFIEGRILFRPYWLLESIMLLKVALMGRSSH